MSFHGSQGDAFDVVSHVPTAGVDPEFCSGGGQKLQVAIQVHSYPTMQNYSTNRIAWY